MHYKSPDELDSYASAKSSFIDYARFEDDASAREATKQDFIEGIIYSPDYQYPRLDSLNDRNDTGEFLHNKKRETYEAVLELEANKDAGYLLPEEHEMYADFHETRLKKIMLVEAASRMRHAGSSSEQQVARQEFMSLCHEVYGEMNPEFFLGMMATEQKRVMAFVPGNDRARDIRQSLEGYFIVHHFDTPEAPLLRQETLDRLGALVEERYSEALSVVPQTGEEVRYNATHCQEVVQAALVKGGLADKGWSVQVNAKKSNPATNVDAKKIYLPSNTLRTASQLRRLIVHEQEVHARRGQNGLDSGVSMLGKGTANYADVEEGLGVLLECAVAGDMDNQSYHRARDRYLTAGIALGLDGNPKDGRATFGLVWRLLALRMAEDGVVDSTIEQEAKTQAMSHTENAFRGTNFAMPGIIYTKLKVYYEGLAKNAQYFEDHIDTLPAALDTALIGKYDHTDPETVQKVQTILQAKQAARQPADIDKN